MSLLSDKYAVDKDAAENGKWFTTESGMRVKVAKLGNPNYKAEIMRLQKPVLEQLRRGDVDSLSNEITKKAMSKFILMDWENEDENGAPIAYTSKLGLEALTEYEDFLEDISTLSCVRRNFSPEDIGKK